MEIKSIEEYEEELVNDLRRESQIKDKIASIEAEIAEWFNRTFEYPSELLSRMNREIDSLKNVQLGIGWLKDMIAALKRESMTG